MTQYKNQFTLGNIIQVAMILCAVAIAYSVIDSRSTANSEDIKEVARTMSALDARVRLIEVNDARATEKFSNILELLARIDARLARIEQAEGAR